MGLAYSINATGYVQNAAGISLVLEQGGTAAGHNDENPWGNRLGSPTMRFQHNPTMDAGLGPMAFSSGRDIWHDNQTMEVVIRGQQFINDNCVIYGIFGRYIISTYPYCAELSFMPGYCLYSLRAEQFSDGGCQ